MENYKLLNTVARLEEEVDTLTKGVFNLQQQMFAMVEQIKYLKLKNLKGEEDGNKV